MIRQVYGRFGQLNFELVEIEIETASRQESVKEGQWPFSRDRNSQRLNFHISTSCRCHFVAIFWLQPEAQSFGSLLLAVPVTGVIT